MRTPVHRVIGLSAVIASAIPVYGKINLAPQNPVVPVELSARWLWNPEAADLETWQFLGANPPEILCGRPGELFILDRQNGHVLRITTAGELVQIVGQRGNGPGEFNNPFHLGYDRESDILWVGDISGARITRFHFMRTTYRYMDSFSCSAVGTDRWNPSLSVLDAHTFSSNYIRFRTDERLPGERITLFRDDGSTICSFGPPWDAEWAENSGHLRRANFGEVICLDRDRIAFVWTMRPIIEIWNPSGQLLSATTLSEPEFQRPEPQEYARDRWIYTRYVTAASYLPGRELLFLKTQEQGQNRLHFLGYSVEDLEIRERYVLTIPETGESRISPSRFAVDISDAGIAFYCIETNTSAVLVLEPS